MVNKQESLTDRSYREIGLIERRKLRRIYDIALQLKSGDGFRSTIQNVDELYRYDPDSTIETDLIVSNIRGVIDIKQTDFVRTKNIITITNLNLRPGDINSLEIPIIEAFEKQELIIPSSQEPLPTRQYRTLGAVVLNNMPLDDVRYAVLDSLEIQSQSGKL